MNAICKNFTNLCHLYNNGPRTTIYPMKVIFMNRRFLVLCSVLLATVLAFTACAAGHADNSSVLFAMAGGSAAPGAQPATAAAPPPPTMVRSVAAPVADSVAIEVDDAAWDSEFFPESEQDTIYGGDLITLTPGMPTITPVITPVSVARRMIVTTFFLDAETMEFDESVNFIRSYVYELGGYVENSSVSGRRHFDDRSARFARFTVRVPSHSIEYFVAVLGERINVVHTDITSDDITERFFDNEARLASLVNQERLLNELLNRGGDLEFILEVHRELANVRHQIELLSSAIQRMERAVSYSTAHISLQEVMQYTPTAPLPLSFGQRINQAASNSWARFVRQMQNSVENFIWDLPYIIMNLLAFAFWIAVFLLVRRFIRKRKGRVRGENTFDWLPFPRLKKASSVKGKENSEDSGSEE